ncbi:argininosuccinate synthase [Natranaerobius thermophilus]|uniref:Argininosuccinate synthase n=1 Tax=Natranaerobius thermophilus (strain ATCC BAA-1301 / DSM 18059 / JW/NM-WN-LF) TaxID=457570 RepID=B2A8E4_NATTJ|nr:argininosuccinate synthase [Natranaerobius thermophilus]ACB84508.1 argininosuccinate synthase [Natranaerobius thermophilus JW/NM-WN-LF]
MSKINKVVLAYSGGLDTSVAIKWIQEQYDCEVIAMIGDVGQKEDVEAAEQKAYDTGASKVYVENLQEEFVTDYIYPAMKANIMYEGKYLLGTAICRPLLGKKLVEIALQENADAIAHGCTGKGNDQVRFEMAVKAMAPHLSIIAPWREWDIKGREDAVKYANKYGIPVPVTKEMPYSIDRNLFHSSYEGGILEDPNFEPDQNMFVMTTVPEQAPDEPEYLDLDFEQGIPVKLNNQELSPVQMMETLNEIGGKHGIGIIDIVENRLLGMKSRGVYETPGGTLLYHAKKELEYLVLDKDTMHFKEVITNKYSELVYNGLWFSSLKQALDGFVEKTQKHLSGHVKLKLYKGNVMIAGRSAPYSLYREDLATFEEDEVYNQKDAEGFINLFGLTLTTEGIVKRGKGGE